MARKKSKAKSQAQEMLAESLGDWFPFSRVRQEVYIGELIESHGFTMEEIARELGNRPHRLFCDILLSDSDGDCAFEYHGEQHYHQIGGMTDTMADLNLNQHLDREKSWILERIGVPLVSVPYDAYIDSSVATRMMEEASVALDEAQAKLYVCDECGRRFPASQLTGGLCRRCIDEENRRAEELFEAQRLAGMAMTEEELEPDEEEWDDGADETEMPDADGDETDGEFDEVEEDAPEEEVDEWLEARKREQKERSKAMRKVAYQRWKESPEYQRRKEEQRMARKAAYQEMKRRKKEGRNG